MAPAGNSWTLRAVSLAWLALLVSCSRGREDGPQPELFIFNELCAMKDDPGPCKAIKERFFFNVDTGRCDLFEYGGCGGNTNNFETLEACEETCVVSEDKSPCHLPEAPGPCRGLVTRYLFDSLTQQCRHFFYGGCFGNANNFRSMAECQSKCQNPVKSTKAPAVHVQAGTRRSGVVHQTVRTAEATVSRAPLQQNPTAPNHHKDSKLPELCLSPVERGTCDGAEKRFAYNPKTKRCQTFVYSGCGGNKNNFTHRRHCIKKCIKINGGIKMIRIRKKNMDNILLRTA
ncbi:tissue factor pathway inhibitor-like [Aulostomus maculatus]